MKRISREVLSARADSMRIEGRMVKAVEEVMAVKKELAKIGKWREGVHSQMYEDPHFPAGRVASVPGSLL